MSEQLYSLKEVSKILNRSIQTLKRAIKSGKLEAEKYDSKDRQGYYIAETVLREYAKRKKIDIDDKLLKTSSPQTEVESNTKRPEEKEDTEVTPGEERANKVQEDYEKLLEQNNALIAQLEEVMSELESFKEKEAKTLSSQNVIIKEKEKLENFLKEVEESMLQMTEQYKELAEQTNERDRKLDHLKNILSIKDEEIDHIRKELEEVSLTYKELNDLKLTYEEQTIEFENIKAEKESLKNQLIEVENVILQMTEQYKSLANQTYDRDKRIEALTKNVEEKDRRLSLQERALKEEKSRDWWDKILGN